MRLLIFTFLTIYSPFALADGTVSFAVSELSVSQTAGLAFLRIRYIGSPTPAGTDDVLVRFVDGTATAGYNYGTFGSLDDLEFRGYDFSEPQRL